MTDIIDNSNQIAPQNSTETSIESIQTKTTEFTEQQPRNASNEQSDQKPEEELFDEDSGKPAPEAKDERPQQQEQGDEEGEESELLEIDEEANQPEGQQIHEGNDQEDEEKETKGKSEPQQEYEEIDLLEIDEESVQMDHSTNSLSNPILIDDETSSPLSPSADDSVPRIPIILKTNNFPYLLTPITDEMLSRLPLEYEHAISLFEDVGPNINGLTLNEIFQYIRETFKDYGNEFSEDEELVLHFKEFDLTLAESDIASYRVILKEVIEAFVALQGYIGDQNPPKCLCLELTSQKSFIKELDKLRALRERRVSAMSDVPALMKLHEGDTDEFEHELLEIGDNDDFGVIGTSESQINQNKDNEDNDNDGLLEEIDESDDLIDELEDEPEEDPKISNDNEQPDEDDDIRIDEDQTQTEEVNPSEEQTTTTSVITDLLRETTKDTTITKSQAETNNEELSQSETPIKGTISTTHIDDDDEEEDLLEYVNSPLPTTSASSNIDDITSITTTVGLEHSNPGKRVLDLDPGEEGEGVVEPVESDAKRQR